MLKHSIIKILFACIAVLGMVACGGPTSSSTDQTPADTPATTAVSSPATSPTAAQSSGPLHLTGVALAVNPSSFASIPCGTTTNIVFTASISVGENSGGTVSYTWNILNSTTPGSVTFAPGETSKTVTYTLSNYTVQLSSTSSVFGSLSAQATGNSLSSSPNGPGGVCKLPGPFQVVGIGISTSPASLTGIACASTITVVYIATITIAPDSNAGTVQLVWTLGNQHPGVSVAFAPTQTVKTITISETGKIGRFSPFPHGASLASTSPNAVSSALVKPTGVCA
jgi:hypothetical protein